MGLDGGFDFRGAQRIGNRRLGQAGDGDDVPGAGLVNRHPVQVAESQQLGNASLINFGALTI